MKTTEVNIRTINRLNRLAKQNKIMFDGGDGLFSLTEIRPLERGEDGADEDCIAVYFDDYKNWYHLEDCKFFILNPVKL